MAPHQVAVLVCIEAGANSAREIAESEKVSAATISRTIAGLVEMGLVTRSPNEADGRRVDLAITDEGCRVMQETREAREEWMAWRLKHLTEEELQHLEIALPALEKIATL
ncbi:MAG: winged helix DNA-binding protein [Intrasporangiaceae bacterium]|nr:winged helix DNA-binding protein [Intrasporangiaceae bacterium]